MRDNNMRDDRPLFQNAGARRTQGLEDVREGMRVVDAAGAELGVVEFVKLGDPTAATTAGSTQPPADLGSVVVTAVLGGEPDVREPKRSQLLRYGFIKVDGAGLTDTDRYIRGDQVNAVDRDTVHLSIRREQIAEEN